MQARLVIALVVSLVVTAAAPAAHAALSPNPKTAAAQAALRDLWLGHIFWVRNVALAVLDDDDAAAKAAETEVVANARAIAGAIEPFYGKPAAEKLFALLAGHWSAVKSDLQATAKGDAKAKEAAMAKAMENADEIAAFLSGANPHLSRDVLKGLLAAHFGHHSAQHVQLKQRRFGEEAKTWELMRGHMNVIADALGDAIAKQFPAKF